MPDKPPRRTRTARATLTRRHNALAINSLQRQVNTLRAVDYGPVQQQIQVWTEKFCSADIQPSDDDVGHNGGTGWVVGADPSPRDRLATGSGTALRIGGHLVQNRQGRAADERAVLGLNMGGVLEGGGPIPAYISIYIFFMVR